MNQSIEHQYRSRMQANMSDVGYKPKQSKKAVQKQFNTDLDEKLLAVYYPSMY